MSAVWGGVYMLRQTVCSVQICAATSSVNISLRSVINTVESEKEIEKKKDKNRVKNGEKESVENSELNFEEMPGIDEEGDNKNKENKENKENKDEKGDVPIFPIIPSFPTLLINVCDGYVKNSHPSSSSSSSSSPSSTSFSTFTCSALLMDVDRWPLLSSHSLRSSLTSRVLVCVKGDTGEMLWNKAR